MGLRISESVRLGPLRIRRQRAAERPRPDVGVGGNQDWARMGERVSAGRWAEEARAVSIATRQVIARRYAWTMFWILTAATAAFIAVPRYWPSHAYLITAIVTIGTGAVARIFLWRAGGKL